MRGWNRIKKQNTVSDFSDPDGVFNGNTSETEKRMYHALKKTGIRFEYQHIIHLSGPSKPKSAKSWLLRDRKADQLTMAVDFLIYLDDGRKIYLDTKGVKESTDPLSRFKYNLLKHKLYEEGEESSSCIMFVYADEVKSLARLSLSQGLFLERLFHIKHF